MEDPEIHLYLNLIPESLVASNLPPEEFGSYMAVGTKFHTRGEALFFELDPGVRIEEFPMRDLEERCRPHDDGSPKRSAYLATYRVLENVPIEQLGNLYLTTSDGRVLPLQRGEFEDEPGRPLHVYQEFCPVTPAVASRLDARDFAHAVTERKRAVSFPRLVFADLILKGLAEDPLGGEIGDLPYRELRHLRRCLASLLEEGAKATKNVTRRLAGRLHYRTIRRGFFVGDARDFAFYPMPSLQRLEGEYYDWWRSACTVAH